MLSLDLKTATEGHLNTVVCVYNTDQLQIFRINRLSNTTVKLIITEFSYAAKEAGLKEINTVHWCNVEFGHIICCLRSDLTFSVIITIIIIIVVLLAYIIIINNNKFTINAIHLKPLV